MKTDLIKEFLNKKNIIAVIGASNNKSKYGNKIFHELLDYGYNVVPVNPKETEIDGIKCYPSLKEIPTKPDVINTVVPPKVTFKIVKQAKKLSINKVWMQPGSESEETITFCKKNNIKVLSGVCIMLSLINN